jgi:hypothetical protein
VENVSHDRRVCAEMNRASRGRPLTGPGHPTNTKTERDVFDQTNVTRMRLNIGYMNKSDYLYTVKIVFIKTSKDVYHPIGVSMDIMDESL